MKNSRAGRLLLVGVGALIGVVVGAVMTDAAGSNGSSSFVPITPCRLMDTRGGGSTIGPRNTPINAGETYSALVWGTNGNCTIPTSAIVVSLNVTAVAPTAQGYVTVYPPDKSLPITSNLNFVAGQKPAPNAVTSPLSTNDGRLGFYNSAGTVNLIADIVGYYEKAGAAPGGIVAGNCGATMRWDLAECKKATVNTGNNPYGIAFDGTNLWVANQGSGSVSRINPATGSKVDFPTGLVPVGVAFDGTSIWVTNSGDNTVSKFNPVTGAKVTFATGGLPGGIAFDGANIWVANSGSGTVSRINPATGTKSDFITGTFPIAVTFDGTSIWVANENSDKVSKVNPSTGAVIQASATVDAPTSLAYDGTNIWATNAGSNTVTKIDPVTGNGLSTPSTSGNNPLGVAFDGTNLWIANSGSGTVVKLDPRTGLTLGTYSAGVAPTGVMFDGSNIWVTNNGGTTVQKFVP